MSDDEDVYYRTGDVYYRTGDIVECIGPTTDTPFVVGEKYVLLSFSDGYVEVEGHGKGWMLFRFKKCSP